MGAKTATDHYSNQRNSFLSLQQQQNLSSIKKNKESPYLYAKNSSESIDDDMIVLDGAPTAAKEKKAVNRNTKQSQLYLKTASTNNDATTTLSSFYNTAKTAAPMSHSNAVDRILQKGRMPTSTNNNSY